ncbi:MAG: hypothetical protein MZV63_47165 [Marinilabiliales bacterium]|nr:hypothetical protein [Marinilabiliales bacterium]
MNRWWCHRSCWLPKVNCCSGSPVAPCLVSRIVDLAGGIDRYGEGLSRSCTTLKRRSDGDRCSYWGSARIGGGERSNVTVAAGSQPYARVVVGPCIGGGATAPVGYRKLTAAVAAPLHLAWSAGSLTWPLGLTVMVKVSGVPAQPSNEGVTVIVAVTGEVPALVAVNDAMLPLPLAASPMLVLLLVHA